MMPGWGAGHHVGSKNGVVLFCGFFACCAGGAFLDVAFSHDRHESASRLWLFDGFLGECW